MLAPEPFFEPRGTPFSEYHRIKALGELGHHVDLVTYPIGRDVDAPEPADLPVLRPPFVRKVRIGPSVTKVVLDALMLLTILAARLGDARTTPSIRTRRWGWSACGSRACCASRTSTTCTRACRSSLSNFKYSRSRVAAARVSTGPRIRWCTAREVVITICQELQDTVESMGAGDRALLIENVMGGDVEDAPSLSAGRRPTAVEHRRRRAAGALHRHVRGVPGRRPADRRRGASSRARTRPRACWSSAASPRRSRPRGDRPQRAAPATRWSSPASSRRARFRRSCEACDILVSPRIRGTNTPLKIYSYLRSGKPIVATDLLTHTQVLSPAVARLVAAGGRAVCRRRRRPHRSTRGAAAPGARPPPSWRRRSTAARRTCAARRTRMPG